MAIIEPVRQDPGNPASNKRFSSGIRLWHWANAIIISGSLITVLINSTLLDNRSNTSFIQTELQKSGTMLSADQAHTIAHAQSDEVWTVHQYFGYLLAAFFIYRLILEPFRPKSQRFFVQLKEAYNGYFVVKQNQENDLHDFVVQPIYMGFYILLAIMVLTGLSLAFGRELGIPRNVSHSIKEVHGFCMYLVIAYIIVHIVGVILAERKRSSGIVSDMINGGRPKDPADV